MRVFELAKELNRNSKDLVAALLDLGMDVKSHMSTISDAEEARVRQALSGEAPPTAAKKPAAKAARPAAKEPPHKEPERAPRPPAGKAPEPAAEAKISDEAQAAVSREVVTDTLIERRVSTTVIRRRRKATPEEPEQPASDAEPEAAAFAATEEPALQDLAAAPAMAPEGAAQQEAAATEAGPAPAAPVPEPAPQPTPKKLKLKEKEHIPARIIDRIDLFAKKEEPAPAAPKVKRPAAVEMPEIVAPAAEEPDKEKAEREKRGPIKDKDKRAKFRWQKDAVYDEEAEQEVAPYPHKRVRYKVKERMSAKVRMKKGEVIELLHRETEKTVPKAIKRRIRVKSGITVAELAKRMGAKSSEVIAKLAALDVMATINQVLDIETATLAASDFNYEIESVLIEEEKIFEARPRDAAEVLQQRCPVVTVMGHVDHGKTTLLDAIRKTKVAEGEKGGITQHIGAYRVSLDKGDIVFVDTPGHEAFTTMRARGARVTDIVILVVAAEEGVKPQTVEAINHAKAAGVPIIVAMNKIDKPDANPERVRQELANNGLVAEEWGGDTIFVPVSAKKNEGIDRLLEMILLQAEMLELKANPDKPAKGTIIEARLDRGRGPIASVLVQEGTLRIGDSFVSGQNFGKVRAIIDDRHKLIKEASPSTPVEILGFSSVPEAGDVFVVVDERKARQASEYWQQKKRELDLRKDARISLENFFSTIGSAENKELRVILKADVQGSAEALKQSLETLSTEEIKVNVLHASVGAISRNDVMLASASDAIVIGFGVKSEAKIQEAAEVDKVDIRLYSIIYDVLDDVKKAMVGMLEPRLVEKLVGKAEVRQMFDISKLGLIAGCLVIEGKMVNGSKARVVRGAEVVHEGEIATLKRYKDDAREVLSGQDCGISLNTFKDFVAGDIIESILIEEVQRTL